VKTNFRRFGVKEDHNAGCFHAVVDEDIRFVVNLDPGDVSWPRRLSSEVPGVAKAKPGEVIDVLHR
jgi:hypothetical protein